MHSRCAQYRRQIHRKVQSLCILDVHSCVWGREGDMILFILICIVSHIKMCTLILL